MFIQFRGFIYLESVSRKLPLITSHTLILLNFCLPSCSGEKLETLILGICDVSCVSHSSIAQLCPTLCNSVDCRMQASLSFTNSGALLKLMSIKLVMLSNHLILCCPLLLLSVFFFLRSFFFFFKKSILHIRWPKYWSFIFSISPSKEYSGLISFRIDSIGLLAVQGTLKSLLQHHSSKASILWCSAFLMVHISHPDMTTGKTVPMTK